MLLTMALLGSADAVGKYLMQTYPVGQVVWSRYAYALPLVVVLVLRRRLTATASTGRPWLQAGRRLMVLSTMAFLYFGLSMLPLAETNSIMCVAPLLVTGFSVPLLGERVGMRRWIGVGAGFAGALAIIRPGTAGMHWAAFLPLIAAVFFALHQIGARVLGRSDDPVTTFFYTSAVGLGLTSLAVPFLWVGPDVVGWSLMAVMALTSGLSNFSLIKAYQAAPAAVVAPFVYTILMWAIVWGYLVFGDVPDAWTVTGALLIVVAGVYVAHRERRPVLPSHGPDPPP
jgi:drug/metabolite transporter (DMT)-like permease